MKNSRDKKPSLNSDTTSNYTPTIPSKSPSRDPPNHPVPVLATGSPTSSLPLTHPTSPLPPPSKPKTTNVHTLSKYICKTRQYASFPERIGISK
mmetsp:Transcript_21144/g.38159  ORF Transcript_21144/g.38159 Transcript_21144/m.38159 type:complete len:94 (+) Transcript_21144:565-846(+)